MLHVLRRFSLLPVMALTVALLTVFPSAPGAQAAETWTRTLTVSGTGVTSYPDFDTAITRYAARTTSATGGTITVTAATSDPTGKVHVNGVPASSGEPVTLTDLAQGDEISVWISDREETTSYSVVVLAPTFPRVAVEKKPELGAIDDGMLFVTLNSVFADRTYAVVDQNGVPVFAGHDALNPMDFKRQANGNYSITLGLNQSLASSFEVVELDARFRELGRYRTVGLVNTDFHEAQFLPNGNRILMAYEPAGQLTHSIAQEIDPNGNVVFEFSSANTVTAADDALSPAPAQGSWDYAHLNAVTVAPDGDWIMSFRGASSVLKVARNAHDGYQAGDVIWRLGGKRSTFAFPQDAWGGPCAQHTATELANGDILLWDNGSNAAIAAMCDATAHPDAPVGRTQSRAVQYRLNHGTSEATVAWEWTRGNAAQSDALFSQFAGSAQLLPNGNYLAGLYNGLNGGDAIEVSPSGDVVWELDFIDYYTYRAQKFDAPDAIAPTIEPLLTDNTSVNEGDTVPLVARCTDRGGSNLVSCGGATRTTLDTSTPGTHTVTFRASDGAGNETTATRRYRVVATPVITPGTRTSKVDLEVRAPGTTTWKGTNRYSGAAAQQVTTRIRRGKARTAVVRLRNRGTRTEKFVLTGTGGKAPAQVTYLIGGKARTHKVRKGFTTVSLPPGASVLVKVKVKVARKAKVSTTRTITITGRSTLQTSARDAVRLRVKVTR